ncbi:MAG: hypothetical protein R3Y35_08515 [Clostridia bacterium]
MALINCPECGREKISDVAELCPECGYPIKRHFEKIQLEQEEFEREKRIYEQSIAEKKYKKDTELQRKKENIEKLEETIKRKSSSIKKWSIILIILLVIIIVLFFFNTYGSFWGLIIYTGIGVVISIVFLLSNIFAKESALDDLEYIKIDFNKYEIKKEQKTQALADYYNQLLIKEDIKHPKCPVCGSNNTERISNFNRSVSVATFGFASSKIGKQYFGKLQ